MLRSILIKYKLVIRFILTFVLVYTVLTIGYKIYLSNSDGLLYYPDYATHIVANQTENLLDVIGYDTEVFPHETEPSMKVVINGKFVARIIGGCNAISIIVLFLSFVIAFADNFKTTFLYCLAGSIIIYAFNLIRIVILSACLYHYPWRREILHTVIFPIVIYGTVFILWMIWVNKFAKKKKVNT